MSICPAMHAILPLAFSIELRPHGTWWTMVLFAAVAIASVIYLHRAQRKLLSGSSAQLLLAIRIGLIALVALMFLEPAVSWTHSQKSDGELWLLVDASPSMQSLDPQSTTEEHLRLSTTLNGLPANAYNSVPDEVHARLTALAGNLARLHSGSLNLEEKGAAQAQYLSSQLAEWSDSLDRTRKLLIADTTANSTEGRDAIDTLGRVLDTARTNATAAGRTSTLDAARSAVSWPLLEGDLGLATSDLAHIASTVDSSVAAQVDSNASLATAAAKVSNVSRADLASQILTKTQSRLTGGGVTFQDLAKRYRLHIASFAERGQTEGAVDPTAIPEALSRAFAAGTSAHATNITAGLSTISEQLGPTQAASVIILSDGRQNASGDPTEAARLLAARGVRVFGLLTGSHEVAPDAAVEQIDAPDWVYAGDSLRAAAAIRLDGLAGQTAQVELRRNGVRVDSRAIAVQSNSQVEQVELTDKPPTTPGSRGLEYEIRVLPMKGEANEQNNVASFRTSIKKDKLVALLIDDRPRWDFRYLAATLSRDPRVKLQTVLRMPAIIAGVEAPPPAVASPDNPHIEAQILPQTPEAWQAFDLIILGDVTPEFLPTAQQQMIATAVRDKGSTLIIIAGQRAMPAGYADSPLAALLPVTMSPAWSDSDVSTHTRRGFRPGLAPEGNTSVLGQLGLDPDSNAALWSNVPLWYWHTPFTQARAAASVPWSITDVDSQGTSASQDFRNHALLATMPVGLGRSLYLASDQTWRLRQVYGQNVHERFWGQVLRWATGSDLPAGGKYVRFGTNQPTYEEDQPVLITARILRDDLSPYTGLSFRAVAHANGAANPVEGQFVESPDSPGYYRATLSGLPIGESEIALAGEEVERLLAIDPSITQKSLTVRITAQGDREHRNMNTDPELLARIAQAGGGFSLDLADADVLAAMLPAIEHTDHVPVQVGLFANPDALASRISHWTVLLLFVLLLTAEWILRKRNGLI